MDKENTGKIKILVIGGSSDIGAEIIKSLIPDKYDIIYTYHSRQKHFKNAKGLMANLSSKNGLNDFITVIKDTIFNIVIYCPRSNPTMLSKEVTPDILESNTWLKSYWDRTEPSFLYVDHRKNQCARRLEKEAQNRSVNVSSPRAYRI